MKLGESGGRYIKEDAWSVACPVARGLKSIRLLNSIDRVSVGARDTEGERHGGGKVSKRAKPLDPEEESHDNDDYYYEDVDERNNPTNEAPAVPPGFLSPSVREYLDLGKSIPGT